jgi:type VI secretion system secreted protein VgrG
VLLEGKTSATGQTSVVSTQRARFVEVQKTIMREDQKITENWAGYISGTLEGATPPSRNPIPDDYLAPTEEAN